MTLNYIISAYPDLLEDMVAKVYETQAPDAEIATVTIPERDGSGVPTPGAGHQVQYTVVFNGLDTNPHILRLYTDSGTLLHSFEFLPTQDIVTVYEPIMFTVGVDGPDEGDTEYVIAALDGVANDKIKVYREIGLFYEWQNISGGGIGLTTVGDKFRAGERWRVERVPEAVTVYVNDSVVGKQWGGFVDVANTTRNYSAGDLRKLIRLSGNSGKYYFLSGAQVPIGYPFRFSNQVGGTANIYFQNGSLITASGAATTYALPSGGILEFVWDGTNWNKTAERIEPVISHTIVLRGTETVGEVFFNRAIPIVFGTDIGTSNYTVLGSLRSVNLTNSANDCTVRWIVRDKTSTGFAIHVRESDGVNQNLYFDWVIVKNA